MAAKPTVGGSIDTWGTELNAFLDVGHDADGTHTKSQMLTDMGWSPTTYAGGATATLPNGLIIKMGNVVTANGEVTVTFGASPFPTGIISAVACSNNSTLSNNSPVSTHTLTVNSFKIQCREVSTASWIAIGY